MKSQKMKTTEKRIKIALWLIENKLFNDNKIIGTYSEIAEELGISYSTVKSTFELFYKNNFVKKEFKSIHKFCNEVSDDLLFKRAKQIILTRKNTQENNVIFISQFVKKAV